MPELKRRRSRKTKARLPSRLRRRAAVFALAFFGAASSAAPGLDSVFIKGPGQVRYGTGSCSPTSLADGSWNNKGGQDFRFRP